VSEHPPPHAALRLEVRRTIAASPARLFAAWTDPAQLRAWWGPVEVSCPQADVDLRVGGRYRIANRFPDGRVVWIAGAFEEIAPPHRLVYTWTVEDGADAGDPNVPVERVTVRFEPRGAATEVIVVHERIRTLTMRDSHERGWLGCLDGLERFLRAE
jgi:uncharacterized protein YndB with AHSA1/START domain